MPDILFILNTRYGRSAGWLFIVIALLATNAPAQMFGIGHVIRRVSRSFALGDASSRLNAYVEQNQPVIRDWNTVFPHVNQLPGPPFRPHSIEQTAWASAFAASGYQSIILPPGDYSIPVQLYCMHFAGGSGPGFTYLLGPFRGTRARMISTLIGRASIRNSPHMPVQILAWELQVGDNYQQLDPNSRALFDQLIPEYRDQLGPGFLESLRLYWDDLARNIPGVPSYESVVDRSGSVFKLIAAYRMAQLAIAQNADNYQALSQRILFTQLGGQEMTTPVKPWSVVAPGVYERLITQGTAMSPGTLEVRVLPSEANTSVVQSASLVRGSFTASSAASGVNVPIDSVVGYPLNCNDCQIPLSEIVPSGIQPSTLPYACPTNGPGAPTITTVSTIFPSQRQTIVIRGHGFGNQLPFIGDSPVFHISDITRGWSAGNNRWCCGGDWVTVKVAKWTDNEIKIDGFAGAYGGAWSLAPNDLIRVEIWNAQTGSVHHAYCATYFTATATSAASGVTVPIGSAARSPAQCGQVLNGPFTSDTLLPGGIPLAQSPGQLSITAIPYHYINQGISFLFAIQVRDCSGTPLPKSNVTLSATGGKGQLAEKYLITNNEGIANYKLTLPTITSFTQGPYSICSKETISAGACGYTTISFTPVSVKASDDGITARITINPSDVLSSTPTGISLWWSAIHSPIYFAVGYAPGFPVPNNPQTPLETICNQIVPKAHAVTTVFDCAITVSLAACAIPLTAEACPVVIAGAVTTGAPFGCANGILQAFGSPGLQPSTVPGVMESGATFICNQLSPSRIIINPLSHGTATHQKVLVHVIDNNNNMISAFVFLSVIGGGDMTVEANIPCVSSSRFHLCSRLLSPTPQLFKIGKQGGDVEWTTNSNSQGNSAMLIASFTSDGNSTIPGSACYFLGATSVDQDGCTTPNPASSISSQTTLTSNTTSETRTARHITVGTPEAIHRLAYLFRDGHKRINNIMAHAPQPSPTISCAVRPALTAEAGSVIIFGRVKDTNGPISGALVTLTASEAGSQASPVTVKTTVDGTFRLPFTAPPMPGVTTISARIGGLPNSSVATTILEVRKANRALPKIYNPLPVFIPILTPFGRFTSGYSGRGNFVFTNGYIYLCPGQECSSSRPRSSLSFTLHVPVGQIQTVAYGILAGHVVNNGPVNITVTNGSGTAYTSTVAYGIGGYGQISPKTLYLWEKKFVPGVYTIKLTPVDNSVNIYGFWFSSRPNFGDNLKTASRAIPMITSVSQVFGPLASSVVIRGSSFGTLPAFNGDSRFFMFENLTRNWRAGCAGRVECKGGDNVFTVRITRWTDNEIDLAGLTGQYAGTPNETLADGDRVRLWLWNPQTGAGPAQYYLTVLPRGQ